jgi:hypothetical protein
LREAIEYGGADTALLDNLTGQAFGEQKALAYASPRRVPDRMLDLINNSNVRSRMLDTIDRGVEMGADQWYDTRPLLAAFIAELGPEEGQTAFRRFIDFNAATSPRSDVATQIKRASLFYGADRAGESRPVPPEGYGHFAGGVHRQLMDRMDDGGFSPITGPKTASYAENLAGNHEPVTIDSHALALPSIFSADPRFLKNGKNPVTFEGEQFNPRQAYHMGLIDIDEALEQPSWWGGKGLDSEYGALADYYKSLGKERGLTGPQAQAAAWVGGGDITGVQSGADPFLKHLVDRIRETAEQRGQSFEQALSEMIRGKGPLLGLLAALQAALAAEGRDEAA